MASRLTGKDIDRQRPPGGSWSGVPVSWAAACCLAAALFLQTGCAARRSVTVPVSGPAAATVLAAFARMRAVQQDCGSFLDAELEVAINGPGILGNGSLVIPGYLQAMLPSYFKFVGVNPLGQPHLILAADGRTFRSVVVPEAKAFTGQVGSATFRKYSPPGFLPEQAFYWLTGRLPPARLEILEVVREKAAPGYWLLVRAGPEEAVDRLLFDADRGVVARRIIQEDQGRVLLDVEYDDYRSLAGSGGNEGCRLPGSIRVSVPYKASIKLSFGEVFPGAVFSAADFTLDLPAGFEQVVVP